MFLSPCTLILISASHEKVICQIYLIDLFPKISDTGKYTNTNPLIDDINIRPVFGGCYCESMDQVALNSKLADTDRHTQH